MYILKFLVVILKTCPHVYLWSLENIWRWSVENLLDVSVKEGLSVIKAD